MANVYVVIVADDSASDSDSPCRSPSPTLIRAAAADAAKEKAERAEFARFPDSVMPIAAEAKKQVTAHCLSIEMDDEERTVSSFREFVSKNLPSLLGGSPDANACEDEIKEFMAEIAGRHWPELKESLLSSETHCDLSQVILEARKRVREECARFERRDRSLVRINFFIESTMKELLHSMKWIDETQRSKLKCNLIELVEACWVDGYSRGSLRVEQARERERIEKKMKATASRQSPPKEIAATEKKKKMQKRVRDNDEKENKKGEKKPKVEMNAYGAPLYEVLDITNCRDGGGWNEYEVVWGGDYKGQKEWMSGTQANKEIPDLVKKWHRNNK